MSVSKGEVIYYGVDNISEKLDKIIKPLNLEKYYFEIKLSIIEAINNAFIHGNDGDKNKSISIKWNLTEKFLKVSVTDCGTGINHLKNYRKIPEDNILEECGRGLYIISSYIDEMKFEGSSIIMKKYLL